MVGGKLCIKLFAGAENWQQLSEGPTEDIVDYSEAACLRIL